LFETRKDFVVLKRDAYFSEETVFGNFLGEEAFLNIRRHFVQRRNLRRVPFIRTLAT